MVRRMFSTKGMIDSKEEWNQDFVCDYDDSLITRSLSQNLICSNSKGRIDSSSPIKYVSNLEPRFWLKENGPTLWEEKRTFSAYPIKNHIEYVLTIQ
mmetsp:Transcript_1338/g.3083  ORF Transcript_1338/g.3083 Transcript_1338/m.3083 type:complete len:97 (-) Transcript_1338:28-318(-)